MMKLCKIREYETNLTENFEKSDNSYKLEQFSVYFPWNNAVNTI